MVVKKAETAADLKSRISDSVKKMKTSVTKDKTVDDIVNEITKRGRTDNVRKDLNPGEKPKGMNEKRKLAKKSIIKEAEEDKDLENHEDEEADAEGNHAEPDGDEDLEGNEPNEEVPETESDVEEPAFDVEENYDNLEGEEDSQSDDIDEIISNLLKTEEIEIDVDAEKGTVKIADKAATEDRGVEAVKGDIELIADEGEEMEDEMPVEEGIEAELENAIEEEKVVKTQLDEMLATFGKSYPKIFNEQFISKLQLIVEMYTNAKAKKKATAKVKTVVESVDVYMNKLENKFKRENSKKLAEAVDIKRKEQLLAQVKGLLESKLGKSNVSNKRVEAALKVLYKENKELKSKINTLRESNFVFKTNLIFESTTKDFSPSEKKLVTSILEGVDFKNTKEFQLKLNSALEVVKGMRTEKKTITESTERKQKFVRKERPIRRSDGVLSTKMIKEAVKNRKMRSLTEDVYSDNDSDIDFDEMEKYIPEN